MKFYLENSFLAGKPLSAVLLREGNIDIEFVADILAYYLILKAGDKLTRTEYQRMSLSLAAVKCLTVRKALKIYNNGIAVLCGSVFNGYHTGIAFRHCVKLSVYLGGFNLNRGLFSL